MAKFRTLIDAVPFGEPSMPYACDFSDTAMLQDEYLVLDLIFGREPAEMPLRVSHRHAFGSYVFSLSAPSSYGVKKASDCMIPLVSAPLYFTPYRFAVLVLHFMPLYSTPLLQFSPL